MPGDLVQRRVVDARTRFQEITNGRSLFGRGQAWRIVVDTEAFHGRAEIDLVLIDGNTDQRAKQALADRMQIGLDRNVAPLGNDQAVLNDYTAADGAICCDQDFASANLSADQPATSGVVVSKAS